MKFVKVYFSIILANYFFVFKSCYCLIHYENLLERLVAMFKFFNTLIESRYLRVSLPFPTLPLNFWCFGGTGRFGRISRVFLLFFWWHVLFSSTKSPRSTSVFLFSNSTISKRCISKWSKHSSWTFGLCESDFNPLHPSIAYPYPLKTSENLKISWYFQEV